MDDGFWLLQLRDSQCVCVYIACKVFAFNHKRISVIDETKTQREENM